MAYFAVHYDYADTPEVDALRPKHRAFLRELADKGQLTAGGPFTDADRPSALLIMRAADAAEIGRILDADPFHLAGLIVARRITGWNPATGILAEPRP